MSTNNERNVTVEIVVVLEPDLWLVRKIFPDAQETEEVVFPAGPVEEGSEPPLLLGQPKIVMGRACCDLRGHVFRATFGSVPEAQRACQLLPDTVARWIRAEMVLDEAQIEALVEHHSRQLMIVEPDRDVPPALESVAFDTYRYHRQRLENLETVLGKARAKAIFLEMRGLYDPVTGDRPMIPDDLRLVAGFRPVPPSEQRATVDMSLFEEFEDDKFPSPPDPETIH